RGGYFFALQPHPQPEGFSSFLIIQSLPPQSAHFFGLHLPSLLAPHFSHLNIAILFTSGIIVGWLRFARRDVRPAGYFVLRLFPVRFGPLFPR
ncbi:MAG: hypothetical protein V1782_10285, partial [Pseudomonadota bacterium]